MKTYIFACVHNAGRSQMAAAFFNQYVDPSQARGISAGTQPGPQVHPLVIDVMQEVGIDLRAARPQKLTDALASEADMLITMGCGEDCPYIPGLRRDDWPLTDPKGLARAEVREIREEILRRVRVLLQNEDLWRPDGGREADPFRG